MEDETRQLIIRLFSQQKKDMNDLINEVRFDINTVYDGQEGLKSDISALETNVKGDISALETKINAGQEELRREFSVFQERIRDIETGQAAFEERVSCTVDTQLTNMSSMVEQQKRNLREDLSRNIEAGQAEFEERVTRNLREELSRNIEASQAEFEERVTRNLREDLSRNIEATRQDVEATRRNLEATQRDLGTQLAALQVQTRRAGAGNAGTNTDKVKSPKFDGSTS
jgi:gas vesicle protein